VVVEARERSGALITADLALEEGRDVFACPGQITSTLAAGTNALLKLGATPLTSAADVLEAFGIEAEAKAAAEVSEEARVLLERLEREPAGVDELCRATCVSAEGLAVALAELELAGLVTEAEGRYRTVR
jgi:DNA processing protein